MQEAICKVVKHQVGKKKTAINLFLSGSQIQFYHIQWPFCQLFSSQVQYVKNSSEKYSLKQDTSKITPRSTWWSWNTDTLENGHLKVFRTIKEFFKLVDFQILSQTSKGEKQGNCLVSSRKGKGWQGKLADKEVWREEKISKLWINQSNNSDEKLFHQNHDWDQSTKICWDLYLLLNVNINSCQQIN